MQTILRDSELQSRLDKEGYIVCPFLTQEEVKRLKDFYYAEHSEKLDGMYATAHVTDLSLRMKMNDFIKAIFKRAIDQTFQHANPLGGSFIAKGKGEKGVLSPHQDWNIVDEDQYKSYNIWVPLVDLTDQNGVICVMPGSHLWHKTYRSANIPSAYHQVDALLWKKMSRLFMKAGEALIYDHRLIHASGENLTDEIRLAAVYGIIPEGAEMRYYHQKNQNAITVFASNPDFFLFGNIFEGPKGLKELNDIPYSAPVIDAIELSKHASKQQSLWAWIKSTLKR